MKSFIYDHSKEMLEMLKKLVNTDSGSYDKEGVDKVGQLLMEHFNNLGFIADVHENEKLGNNIVLRHQDARRPKFLIVAHMDTVFPKGTVDERPFSMEDGFAYGPGVIDMKASHVMLYYAMKALMEENVPAYKDVEIIFNSDEEIGTIGSRKLIEEKAKDKEYVLVLEPARPSGSFVSSRRGVGQYQLEIRGKSAHSGMNPEDGISAIEEMAHKIIELKTLEDPENGLNINIGLIEGGTSVNTVAPIAKAGIDVRISTQEQAAEIDEKIQKVCNESTVTGAELTLTGGINRPPMEFASSVGELVDIVLKEAESLGIEIDHIASGGGSDASFTAAMGIPTIDGMGPVGGKQHTEREYLVIDTLMERTTLFINVVRRLHKMYVNE
ncbi:M20 family metallopeptidase [Salinicoccus jeotgali]|uniref:M20 family metallopeptidase n=1 Tax=Salinicoccus jeotgali TaxID=381634 RepID=A0ABP7EQI4_9STAP